jgi:glycosyltransferase involved in cell wall biosynthesis
MSIEMSVIVPTMRVGGMDVLLSGLAGQTYQDFELVLVDGLRRRRLQALGAELWLRARERPDAPCVFPIQHIEPIDNPFPMNAYCRYVNSGLVVARGQIVVLLCDYMWLHPECLQRHADFHRSVRRPNATFMGTHSYMHLPALHPDFTQTYGPPANQSDEGLREQQEAEGIGRYVSDLEAGRLDAMMWSIFAEDCTDPRELPLEFEDSKATAAPEAVPALSLLKNESFSLHALLEVNGLWEGLDGAHGYQDTELYERLTARGQTWHYDRACSAYVPNPRHVMYARGRSRPNGDNHARMVERRARMAEQVNDWDLAAARKVLQWKDGLS